MVKARCTKPRDCQKIKLQLGPTKPLSAFERLDRLSVGKLEEFAKKDKSIIEWENKTIMASELAVDVLKHRYWVNEMRPAVRDALKRLKVLEGDRAHIAKLAALALRQLAIVESIRQPSRGPKKNVATKVESDQKKAGETPKKNVGKYKKEKRRGKR